MDVVSYALPVFVVSFCTGWRWRQPCQCRVEGCLRRERVEGYLRLESVVIDGDDDGGGKELQRVVVETDRLVEIGYNVQPH